MSYCALLYHITDKEKNLD